MPQKRLSALCTLLLLAACTQTAPPQPAPHIVDTTPAAGASGVGADQLAVSARLELVNGSGISLSSFSCDTIYFERVADQKKLCGSTSTNAGRNVINFTSLAEVSVEENTTYRFVLTSGATDQNDVPFVPFEMTFTTGKKSSVVSTFERTLVYEGNTGDTVTSLIIGPDGKLYAGSLEGKVRRWSIDPISGALTAMQVYSPAALAGRPIIGIAFDPTDPAVLWLTNNDPIDFRAPACDFTSRVSRLTLSGGSFTGTLQDYVIGLPRSTGDHFSNGLRFGPSGKLYLSQGSHTHHGGSDKEWKGRPERKLSAAVLEIDPRRPDGELPINVQTDRFDVNDIPEFAAEYGGRCTVTEHTYNPFAANAPVTVYAAGLRNAFDLMFHSNGRMYAAVNGPNFPGNTPASPDGKVPATQEGLNGTDFLAEVKQGRYYGHANPSLGHYVYNGGNPSSGQDPYQYDKYPEGVKPDPLWDMPVADLGMFASSNGLIEYRGNNQYRDNLFIAYYGADFGVYTVSVKPDGTVSNPSKLSGTHANALSLVENPLTGDIYVAELWFGTPKGFIELLKPLQ